MIDRVTDRVTERAGPHRAARAVVVAALVTPAVVLAHLLTRGVLPGPAGLLAVAALAGLVTTLVPDGGRWRLAAAVVAAQAAGHTLLALTMPGGTGAGCLPAVGRGARAGLDLALLRADATCPTGTLAAGPALTGLLGAVLTGVAVVAGNVLVAAVAARLVVAWEALATRAAGLVEAVLPALPAPLAAAPVGTLPRRVPAHRVPLPVARTAGPAPVVRRGPPLVTA